MLGPIGLIEILGKPKLNNLRWSDICLAGTPGCVVGGFIRISYLTQS